VLLDGRSPPDKKLRESTQHELILQQRLGMTFVVVTTTRKRRDWRRG
jgi:ABC-type Fe3+/spermidine/putrescine transport system ATPase subunit